MVYQLTLEMSILSIFRETNGMISISLQLDAFLFSTSETTSVGCLHQSANGHKQPNSDQSLCWCFVFQEWHSSRYSCSAMQVR